MTFSDGRVLCYLIHHYHPCLLPEEAVSHSTTQTVECSQRGRLELDCSASDSDNSFDSFPTGLNGTCQLCAVSSVQLSVWMHFFKKIFKLMFYRSLAECRHRSETACIVQRVSYNLCISEGFLAHSKHTCCEIQIYLLETMRRVFQVLKYTNVALESH